MYTNPLNKITYHIQIQCVSSLVSSDDTEVLLGACFQYQGIGRIPRNCSGVDGQQKANT